MSVSREVGRSANRGREPRQSRKVRRDRAGRLPRSPWYGRSMTSSYVKRVEESTAAIRAHSELVPRVGIVLGTGLGALAEEIEVEEAVAYDEIPGFPEPTVESHSGRLVLGSLGGTPVVAMQGRFHRYEGYSLQEVTFPVRVLHDLGWSEGNGDSTGGPPLAT